MYKPTIGLEIHVELQTKSKMFCSCLNDSDEKRPNFNICPICLGHPGTLPVINLEAVKKVIKTGLALNCKIAQFSKFDRKNYFYPDLPKGYQISQYDQPFCENGFLEIGGEKIRIKRIHLEEDTGSLVHPESKDYSLVNFNRAGVPLMELVTEPDIFSSEKAKEFAKEFHLIMHYLDISDADMEKGQMRVEVNISMAKSGNPLGTKVEIKNLNSFRSVERAIEYEIKRQADILNDGGKIIQETRGWDDVKGKTISQREKEEAHDYRYFPEPDLPRLGLSKEFIEKIKSEIPELPQKKRERFKREYNLLDKEIEIFVYNKSLGEYFEKVVSELPSGLSREDLFKLGEEDESSSSPLADARVIKLSLNYLITDLQGLLKGGSVASKNFLITPENFAEFITIIYQKKISSKIAKMVLAEMFRVGADPSNIIKEKGLVQISDEKELEKIIMKVISENKKAVGDYKAGKKTAVQYLIGKIMAETRGKAEPGAALKELRRLLN
jgi:aspartyl-tRNA(Asn)/glutamyl-tRNA(Gln) amidotransferase subunit B